MIKSLILFIALIPNPPILECQVELSNAAQMSWSSHDTSLVCSSPGYLEALSKGSHFTSNDLTCLCSTVPRREPFLLPECEGQLFCDLRNVCVGETCYALLKDKQ